MPRVPEDIRRQLIFEKGYGGITDSEISAQTGGIATRHELLADIGKMNCVEFNYLQLLEKIKWH